MALRNEESRHTDWESVRNAMSGTLDHFYCTNNESVKKDIKRERTKWKMSVK